MIILGIETSCDETAAAVVENGKRTLSSVVSSSLEFHKKYGGIIPEIAFRKQLETIAEIVDCAIKDSGVKLSEIGAVCVTGSPGLMGSLLVGLSFAKALALSLRKPLFEIDHLFGHLYAPLLTENTSVKLPAIGLVVSGGHTSLYYVRSFTDIKLLGSTRDDACGEAFDKVAKILGLGYPGGPVIEKTAVNGDPAAVKFACSNANAALDFSYSGIKTAVMYYAQKNKLGVYSKGKTSSEKKRITADVCASFQDKALGVLVDKTLAACEMKKVSSVLVGGGVAANNSLRDKFFKAAAISGLKVFFPSKANCMDNAAMIAGIGYHIAKKGRT